MKHLPLLVVTLFFFSACNKSANSPQVQPTSNGLWVDSTVQSINYPLGYFTMFSYDSGDNIASIQTHNYWTPGGALEDTSLRIFNFSVSSASPSSYDFAWFMASNPTDAKEHHVLIYDNQNRIILDSMEYGTSTNLGGGPLLNLTNIRYMYFPDFIVIQSYNNNPGPGIPIGQIVSSIDTIFVSNGNVTENVQWYVGGGTPILYKLTNYNYTKYANPLFQQDLAKSMGAFLLANNVGDFISANYINPFVPTSSGDPFSYDADSSNNLTGVNEIQDYGGVTYRILQFKYHR
jgi:hypothetical protein